MSSFDFKKEYKDLYMPKAVPQIIEVPKMKFIMVEGKGNPNDEDGEYQTAVQLLYSLCYTIKMSKMKADKPEGYFDYVVPPLEGFWWMEDREQSNTIDYNTKEKFHWISAIRQPEFVTEKVFEWAKKESAKKKPDLPYEKACLKELEEGRCVQMMHIGPYDDEPRTIKQMDQFMEENHLVSAIGDVRADGTIKRHHEIYLGDPRKTAPEKRKTVLRHPIR